MTHATDILVHSGRYFDFENLAGNVIDIEDIAQGLSNVCRFGGQVPEFYSVAQHSVLVFQLLRDVLGVSDPATLMQGLLHDATEAYLGDVVSPLKRLLGGYQAIETRLNVFVMRHFNLPLELPPAVKRADLMALAIEKRELWGNRDEWAVLQGVPETPWELTPYSPRVARSAFMRTFQYMERERKLAL